MPSLLDEADAAFGVWVVRLGQGELEGDGSVRSEAGGDRLQGDEAAQHQAAGDQQHKTEADLGDDQGASQVGALTAGGGATAFAQCRCQVAARAAESG